tara:strand:+ start:1539 stop:2612 length:1074 start_codon:yes stop_codon:yes gene_type:complete
MDLNNFYSKKYLKYKKKYLNLKGNGPNDLKVGDKIIKYIRKSEVFNRATINRSIINDNGSTTYYATDDNSGRIFEINSKNENQNWIRVNDPIGFYDPSVQQVWDKHGLNPKNQKKQSSPAASPPNVFRQPMSNPSTSNQSIFSTNSPNDIKVNIKLPIIMNQAILERIKKCLQNGGTIEHAHHLTLYSGTTNNYNDLKIITNNSNNIRDIFFEICEASVDAGTGGYKILGRNLPQNVKKIINVNYDSNYIDNLIRNHGHLDNNGGGVFLAKVFFDNDVNLSELYKVIKYNNTLKDDELYEEEKYDNFTLHLSLAKFKNVGKALTALKEIYSSQVPTAFNNYFNYRSNFAKHLNISIN